jgi:hypothetical protein
MEYGTVNQIDRYIFWEWLRAFLLALGATLGLLIIFDMYDNLGDLLDFQMATLDILSYYMIVLPTLLPDQFLANYSIALVGGVALVGCIAVPERQGGALGGRGGTAALGRCGVQL